MVESQKKLPLIHAGRDVKLGQISGQAAIGNKNVQYSDCIFLLADGSKTVGQIWRYTQGVRPSIDPCDTFGREVELRKIKEILQINSAIAITGIRGTGKSTLASMYVNEIEMKNCFAGIYWRHIDETTDIGDIIDSFFTVIGKPIGKLAQYKMEDQLSLFFGEIIALPYLIVFDNFEVLISPQTNKPLKAGFSELIERANQSGLLSKFIFTCWECPISDRGIRPSWYKISGLDESAALKLLQKEGLIDPLAKLSEAVHRAEGHPLALILLAQLVSEGSETLQQALSDDSLWNGEVAEKILNRVYNERLSNDERKLLQYLSLYREPVPLAAIIKVANWDLQFAKIISFNLIRKSLLNKASESYWEDSLIRSFVYNKLDNKKKGHQSACQYYLSLPLPKNAMKKDDVHSLIEAHFQACMAEDFDEAARILFEGNLYDLLDKWGNYRALIGLCSMFFKNDKELYLKDQPKTIALIVLGSAYRALNDYNKSIEYNLQAIESARNTNDKINEGVCLGNIGNAYSQLNEYKKAFEYYTNALEIAKQTNDKTNEGNWLGNLGNISCQTNHYKRGITFFMNALKIAKQTGDIHRESVWLGNLGNVYNRQGKYNKAIGYYQQALALAKQTNDRHGQGSWLGGLGNIYRSLGDNIKGINFYCEALKIARQIENRRGQGLWLCNLGNAFCGEKKYAEALTCYVLSKNLRDHLGNSKDSSNTDRKIEYLKKEMGDKEFEQLLNEIMPKLDEIISAIEKTYSIQEFP